MKPYAIALVTTTPIGWKMLNSANKNRLSWGINSKQIVVSIGILPPIPNPTKAVTTRKAL